MHNTISTDDNIPKSSNENNNQPEWFKSCNICIQGRVEFLTNCGHLLCMKCKDASPSRCKVCDRTCSTMHMANGIGSLPPEIKMLFEPLNNVMKCQEKRLLQTHEFQKSQQNRLITNLRQKLKYMADKWNQLVNRLKEYEQEISKLRHNQEILLMKLKDYDCNTANSSTINLTTSLSSTSVNYKSSAAPNGLFKSDRIAPSNENTTVNDFVSNFTPLKDPQNPSYQQHNRSSSQSFKTQQIDRHLLNPKQRMSVRTPQSVPNAPSSTLDYNSISNNMKYQSQNMFTMSHKTPSPYRISPGGMLNVPKSAMDSRTPSPRLNLTMNNSTWMPTSTPGTICASSFTNYLTKTSDRYENGTTMMSKYHQREPIISFGSKCQSNPSHSEEKEIASKANSALMRLSQSLAARSMKKSNDC